MPDLLTPASEMPADDMAIAEARTRSRGELLDKLAQAINFTNTENASNTPDFILANFAAACLDAFAEASVAREAWYGKSLSIGGEASDIAALEARTPAPVDDPEMDGTDFAHPAWWRGHDQTTAMFCHHVQVILDGRAVKDESVSPEPWHTIRQRLLALMEKPAPALRETLAREQVAANVLCDTHEELGMHRAYVEDLTKERDDALARAEKAEEKLNNARYMPTQEQLESIYAALPKVLTPWREVARSHGYSMAFHGSLARDIDISFMPWIGSPSTAEALIDGLLAAADFAICPEKTNPGEVTVHGRRRWVILGAIPGPAYFDISVWPTQAERDALKADLAAARKELAGLQEAFNKMVYLYESEQDGEFSRPEWVRRVLEGGAQ